MVTLAALLIIIAIVLIIAHGAGRKVPLWVGTLVLSLAVALVVLPGSWPIR